MTKPKNAPIIFASYFCGIKGMVMAEWADDKLRVLSSWEKKVFVITSLYCEKVVQGNLKYYRVPSLSWRDFSREVLDLQARNAKLNFWQCLFTPVAFVFGSIFDLISSKWINADNPARWSWAVSSFPVVIYLRLRYKCIKLFCTGGAAGAYLLGAVISRIFRVKLYVEFQDPIIGSEIHRNFQNENLITKFEEFLIESSRKTVFVTKRAAHSASIRHPKLAGRIYSIYPGSWLFPNLPGTEFSKKDSTLEFIHLGTLYGSRNLENLFIALDQLILEEFPNANKVKIKNLGSINIYPDNIYSKHEYFENLEPLDRVDAINRCLRSNVLILIQHSDSRSFETIPYKTYDYFNLEMPIFGILNNDELKEMLSPLGHFIANAGDVHSIKSQLSIIINTYFSRTEFQTYNRDPFRIANQFKALIEE